MPKALHVPAAQPGGAGNRLLNIELCLPFNKQIFAVAVRQQDSIYVNQVKLICYKKVLTFNLYFDIFLGFVG
ncbi:MAG TPA: hypothetical protein PKI62_13085 [bacterium]|nr:hypothetical protein [bacterium]HPR87292.1 hypothetical protein [bacterium]